MRRSFLAILGLLVLTFQSWNCGQAGGVLLVLTADGAWNSDKQVANVLSQIEVLFDAQGGFTAGGDGQLIDVDGDGEDELLVILNVSGRDVLPSLRLEAGHSAQQAIAVRVRGLDAEGQLVAYGGVPAQQLFDGMEQLAVPLDLRRSQVPAFVTAVSPVAVPAGGSLAAVAFFVSRPLQAESLSGRAHVSLAGRGELLGDWSSRDDCPDGAQMWIFSPAICLEPLGSPAVIDLRLDAGLLDLQGQPVEAFSAQLDLELAEFGACQPLTGCSEIDAGVPRPDLRCHVPSGLFEPAPCSNAPGSCLGDRNAFGMVSAPDSLACEAYRPGSVAVDGGCVIMDAWPCLRQSDCRSIGIFSCDFGAGLCVPDACLDSCPAAGQICVPDWGCQPGLGACLEPCAVYGSCPDFSQGCNSGDDGLWSCRTGD